MVASSPTELRRALDADEIVPYFQPLVELRTGRLKGFEALARWRHPIHGSISPDIFIPLAEESGLIGLLSQTLLRRVFSVAATVPGDLSISFNLSALQFHDRALPEQIYSAAQQAEFSLKRLILEITESALIDNIDQANSIAQELKTLDIRLALDDFGTGYSSLRHLQALPFDEIKIDASFVRAMSNTRESRKIVAAVVGLGHSLGLTTVAEGIETKPQADTLLWLACDLGQGWLYGPPVPASDLPSFLSTEPIAPSSDLSTGSSESVIPPHLEALPAQRLLQLQAIYDAAPVGLCFLDANMRYVSINKHLAEMNGVPIADHLGKYVPEVLPKFFPTIEPYIRRALAGETFRDLELTSPRLNSDGHFITLLLSYQPIRDEASEIIGVSVAAIDITSRKVSEEALRESEALMRAIFDAVPMGILISDASSGQVMMSNPRAETILRRPIAAGMDIEVYRQLNIFDADGRNLKPEEYPTVRAIQTGEITTPEDILYRRGDGTKAWVRATAAPFRDKDGKIAGVILAIQDIDEARQEKQILLNLISTLEQRLRVPS
jgi:PAS domain S-box-containing protein